MIPPGAADAPVAGGTRAPAPSPVDAAEAPGHATAYLTLVLVVLLTTVGGVLRFTGIGDKSLWIDEAFSVWVARQPYEELLRTVVDLDFHPPLYYSVMHVWLVLGDGETALRSLSALVSVLTLPVVHLIGTRLGGRALGLLSLALVAFSPLNVAYAQQARMYALLTFFAALSLLAALALLDEPTRPTSPRTSSRGPGRSPQLPLWWALFVVSTTLTMLSHNTAVLMWLATAVFVAVAVVRRTVRGRYRGAAVASPAGPTLRGPLRVGTGLVAAAALWLPWLPHFVSQARRVDEEFWIAPPTVPVVLGHWHDLVNAYASDGAYRQLVLLGAAALVLLGVGRLRDRPDGVLLLVLLVLVPVVVELLVSLRRPVFYSQTLVWTSVPFAVLLAAGMLRLRPRPVVALVAGTALLLNLAAVRNLYQQGGREEWRAAVEHAAGQTAPGDLVLFSAAWSQIPFDYYYQRSDGPPVTRHGLPRDVADSTVLEALMTPDDLSRLETLTRDRSGFWLVASHDWYTDPEGLVPARLSESFRVVGSRSFPGVTLTEYRSEAARS